MDAITGINQIMINSYVQALHFYEKNKNKIEDCANKDCALCNKVLKTEKEIAAYHQDPNAKDCRGLLLWDFIIACDAAADCHEWL